MKGRVIKMKKSIQELADKAKNSLAVPINSQDPRTYFESDCYQEPGDAIFTILGTMDLYPNCKRNRKIMIEACSNKLQVKGLAIRLTPDGIDAVNHCLEYAEISSCGCHKNR